MDEQLVIEAKKGFSGLKADEAVKLRAVENIKQWLNDERLVGYRPYIAYLVEKKLFSELLDSFWRVIPFGTGGRRGPVGAGPNRINPHTIALSVQGHCHYLRETMGIKGELKVVIGYDVRRFNDLRGKYKGVDGLLNGLTSQQLAAVSATTYAANGVIAYVIGPLEKWKEEDICRDRFISTPELSFLIRELGAQGGLNISASHNHPDDNGGKFYNMHGGQEIPPQDEALLKMVERVETVEGIDYSTARENGLIRFVPEKLHERYIAMNMTLCPFESKAAKVAFTPLCGTGISTVGETLKRLCFETALVEGQSHYDGSFSSVRYRIANPEIPETMDRLEQAAKNESCDIGFATDPDADRLGMIIPDKEGGFRAVNGDEIGLLLLQSILSSKNREGKLPLRPIFITTAVTSSLQKMVARRYGCQVIGDLMVGFKYMGDVLMHLERFGRFPPEEIALGRDVAFGALDDFVFACEESHGYLLTHRVRDKDACGAAVHLASLASHLKDEGKSVLGMLRDMYRTYGYYSKQLRFLVMDGITGLERIELIQKRLRTTTPKTIAGLRVLSSRDNQKVGGPILGGTDAASRNVLQYEIENGDAPPILLAVRPSGTEPKIKIYVEVPSKTQFDGTLDEASPRDLARISEEDLDRIIAATDEKASKIGNEFIMYCLGPEVMGDIYPEVPKEALLVVDLVAADYRIRLCVEILPELLEKLSSGKDGVEEWLDSELKPFGEEPRAMVRKAALAWLDRAERERDVDSLAVEKARSMFDL